MVVMKAVVMVTYYGYDKDYCFFMVMINSYKVMMMALIMK